MAKKPKSKKKKSEIDKFFDDVFKAFSPTKKKGKKILLVVTRKNRQKANRFQAGTSRKVR